MFGFLQSLIGNNSAKEVKKMRKIVDHINELEPNYVKLSDANLVAKTDEFKRRLQKGETLDDILPEAFAVCREASKRVLGMRHFDVQMLGGICLHRGNIAEMRTGEGKTLVATLAVYLNALSGKGVHVVTVNDYLATRDSEQMGRLYNFLGLSTGLIVANLDYNQRKEAYAADVTYGTNNELIAPTDSGITKVEKMLGIENLYDADNIELNHLLGASLRAYAMMHRDTDYVVKDGEVVIVDEFTGRLMFGRRYSDGLHQAIEAKEGLKVERESQTLASITFQNYFRMYEKLSGMTGTAKTEEKEFNDIYGLEVIPIPPNRPLIRVDLSDLIFKSKAAKYRAVVRNAVERHQTGQPILIGTTSITQSEELSDMLLRAGVPHKVLNAKHHEQEAEIVANAGQMGMVTIATNMAGRGTDITLGEGVPELGGLAILGTERHESRRIDNQLRGRAGRQGDPGSSQFFLSLEDDLMRIFGADNISGIMDKLGMEEDEPIEHSLITKSIERAQKKVEDHNYNIRKYILEYDDVMNQQREVLYEQRRRILGNESLRDTINEMIDKLVTEAVDTYADEKLYPEEWDYEGLHKHLSQYFLTSELMSAEEMEEYTRQELDERLHEIAHSEYQDRVDLLGEAMFSQLEKAIMLRVVDSKWMEHLDNMDMLREGIGLRAYGQKNPLVEYKFEAYDMFQHMIESIQDETIMALYKIRAQLIQEIEQPVDHLEGAQPHHEDVLEPQNID